MCGHVLFNPGSFLVRDNLAAPLKKKRYLGGFLLVQDHNISQTLVTLEFDLPCAEGLRCAEPWGGGCFVFFPFLIGLFQFYSYLYYC